MSDPTETLYWYRSHPMGNPSGPFTEEERADMGALPGVVVTWTPLTPAEVAEYRPETTR